MSSASDPRREFGRVRHAVLLGLFCGTGVGLGYLLSGVPGVELMTTNAGLAGLALGPLGGAAVGLLTQGVYSLGSPFGPPVPQVLAAQLAGMAVAGLAGGLVAPAVRRAPARAAAVLAAGGGLTVSLLYDLLTNLAVASAFAMPLAGVLTAGLVVAALHAVVVTTAWAVLMPLLAFRLERLRRPGTRAVAVAPWLAGLVLAGATGARADGPSPASLVPASVDSGTVAAADSVMAAIPDSLLDASADTTAAGTREARRPDLPPGWPDDWTRPPWQPFHADLQQKLSRTSSWLTIRDGGHGSAAVIMGEPGSSPAPTFRRDGVPLGVGHRYLDDVEAIPLAGRRPATAGFGLATGGAMHGAIVLDPRDPRPGVDLLDTRWYAGPHDSFLRDVQFLTADAPWRLAFDFYEIIDTEGFDFRVPGEIRYADLDQALPVEFWGQFKTRGGRGRLIRRLTNGDRVTLSLENVRKHKHAMPVYDLEHQELWRNTASLRWRAGGPGDRSAAVAWWDDADLLAFADEDAAGRLIEGSRSGLAGVWAPAAAPVDVEASYLRWRVRDEGADADWAPAHADTAWRRGEEVALSLARRWRPAGLPLTTRLEGWWAQHGGLAIGGLAAAGADRGAPGWRLALAHGGRAPRSDELATPWRVVVPDGRQTVLLPNADLERERQWRLSGSWLGTLGGWDLEIGGALRRLRHGIGWEPSPEDPEVGRWTNGVDLDATSVRVRVARAMRLLGWLRLEAAGAWHGWRRHDDLAVALPPRLQYRLSALWEQHVFEEDGVVQVGAFLHNRGVMDDPWFLAEPVELPAVTTLDLILGFRLVGTNLSAELHNLAGSGSRVSANAVNEPLELRWRLHWTFRH